MSFVDKPTRVGVVMRCSAVLRGDDPEPLPCGSGLGRTQGGSDE